MHVLSRPLTIDTTSWYSTRGSITKPVRITGIRKKMAMHLTHLPSPLNCSNRHSGRLSQQNLQSRNLLTRPAPSGRHEMVGECHQGPRSQSAQELVGSEFLVGTTQVRPRHTESNFTSMPGQQWLPFTCCQRTTMGVTHSSLAQRRSSALLPACERHVVRSAKHALHRQRHRSKICVAAMHFVRHDKRLFCQRVTGPRQGQFNAVELPYGTENC